MNTSKTSEASKRKILLVEDEEALRELYTIFLERSGYVVVPVAGGHEAYELFKMGDIDLVVSDIKMPGGDGIELLSKIRETSDIPVIMVTGYAEEEGRVIEMGASALLTKPTPFAELISQVSSFLS